MMNDKRIVKYGFMILTASLCGTLLYVLNIQGWGSLVVTLVMLVIFGLYIKGLE